MEIPCIDRVILSCASVHDEINVIFDDENKQLNPRMTTRF